MNTIEITLGFVLAVILVALAGYFGRRQFQTLRTLRADPALPGEDKSYLRAQVRRRLLCSILMVLFAGFLVGWIFIADNLPEKAEVEAGRGSNIARLVGYYWIAALLILLGILMLAAFDFFATARYGMRQKRLLNLEHRANLELDAARIRKERQAGNGST